MTNGKSALAAHIVHIVSIGPIVRLEWAHDDSPDKNLVHAEITKDRFRELQLSKGEQVYIRPRKLELFPSHSHAGLVH